MSAWKTPDWVKPYEQYFVGVTKLDEDMAGYTGNVAQQMATPEGRAIGANAQVGLLTALRAAGLLKEVPACPVEKAAYSDRKVRVGR